MDKVNRALMRRMVLVEGFKSHLAGLFRTTLKNIDRYLRLWLTEVELMDLPIKQRNKSYDAARTALAAMLGDYGSEIMTKIGEFVGSEGAFVLKAMQGVADKVAKPTAEAIQAAVAKVPLPSGELVDEVLKKFSAAESDRIVNAVRLGVYDGKTNAEIMKDLRGTAANKFNDGIVATTGRNAEAMTRTLTAHSATQARLEVAAANSDIVEKAIIVATLDSRTSAICRAKSGQIVELERKNLPPFHINCRSSWILKLADEYAPKNKDAIMQSSKDGYVGDMTYYQWLKTQDAAFQDEVLGKTRGKLFRDGGLTADEFARLQLDKNHRPRTLQELQDLEPLAFERAGI